MKPSIVALGALTALILFALPASAHPKKTHSPKPHTPQLTTPQKPLACDPSDKGLEKKQKADEFNARMLAEALRERGLTQVPMVAETVNGVGASQSDPASNELFIVAGTTQTGGQTVPSLTFVEDAAHDLSVVDIDPDLVSDETHRLCGCGPPVGGALMMRTVGYRIPKSRSFKGHLKLRVKQKYVTIQWSNTQENGSLCPMPPMAMPGHFGPGPR